MEHWLVYIIYVEKHKAPLGICSEPTSSRQAARSAHICEIRLFDSHKQYSGYKSNFISKITKFIREVI